ncbi:MAG: hypothetical protein RL220_815 [Bacteroidota bacterium]
MKDYLKLLFGPILITVLLFVGCTKEDDTEDQPDLIRGRVIDEHTGEPIPWAVVNTGMLIFDGTWTPIVQMIDTLTAFSDGGFQLDRLPYRNLEEEYPDATFFICADGDIANDWYVSNCEDGGVVFKPSTIFRVTCKLNARSWVRVFVQDTGTPNPEVSEVEVYYPWDWSEPLGVYPTEYIPEEGFLFETFGYQSLDIPAVIITGNDATVGNDITMNYQIETIGKDTIDVFIEY